MSAERPSLSDLSDRVALLAREIEAGKAWGTVLLPLEHGDTCGATLNEAEEALCVVVDRLRAETELRGAALGAIMAFSSVPHPEPCGTDACLICLIEGVAKDALRLPRASDEGLAP